MIDQEKVDAINNVLKSVTDALEQHAPGDKFSVVREYKNWDVRYILHKNSVKQDISIPFCFITDVLIGYYPVDELIAACKYQLNSQYDISNNHQ